VACPEGKVDGRNHKGGQEVLFVPLEKRGEKKEIAAEKLTTIVPWSGGAYMPGRKK